MKNKIIITFGMIIMSIAIFKIYDICITNHDKYSHEYDLYTEKYITLDNSERGKILDINGKILVDNVGINTLIYNSSLNNKLKLKDIALEVGKLIDIDISNISDFKLKKYYMETHDCNNLLTNDEQDKYKEGKLSKEDIGNLKMERITKEMLDTLTLEEKKSSQIFYLLNNGYSFENKIIKRELTDGETAKIVEAEIPGIKVVMTSKRIYPYESTLRTILGNISINSVPSELKDYYLKKGLRLNNTVGISGLELMYDDYLRGVDDKFILDERGNLTLYEKGHRGSDIYLTIDIEKQIEIENILKEEMQKAKNAPNTDYYNHSFVLIGNPKTGGVVASSGLLINKDHFTDITTNIVKSSYTVGSIVKGSTTAVGYQNNLIKIGDRVTDGCIKVRGSSAKCSWRNLGNISDKDAIAYSSNYFQFLIATRLASNNYKWDAKINATKEHFDIYRNMLASYGLGVTTGIDLPGENTGIIGKKVSDDLLLNLAIGQYDTYTPAEVLQYINTIANNGIRLKLHYLEKVIDYKGNVIYNYPVEVLNKVEVNSEYLSRIEEGFRAVMTYGTGRNYNKSISSGGKTGTSETFVDTNNDGIIDKGTITSSFIMYAPYENPEYTIAIISPNIGIKNAKNGSTYSLNLRLNQKITKYLFEK